MKLMWCACVISATDIHFKCPLVGIDGAHHAQAGRSSTIGFRLGPAFAFARRRGMIILPVGPFLDDRGAPRSPSACVFAPVFARQSAALQ